MSALDGVLPGQNRRRLRMAAMGLCIALTIIFAASGSTFLPIFGIALCGALYYLVRDQIRARLEAEKELEKAYSEQAALRAALDEVQARVRQCGNADQAIAHALALQEKLRNTETLHDSLVNTLPFFIYRKDLDGKFIFANERFCKHLALSSEKIIGRTDMDLYPTELAAKYRRDDLLVRQSETNLDLIETHHAPDGSTQYVHVVKSPIFNADGKLVGIQGVFWDVTERRRAEEKLAAEKDRLCVTLRSIGDGVISTDTNGSIILMNQVAEELTGWTQTEAKGRPLSEVFKCIDPKNRGPIQSQVVSVLETGNRSEPGHRSTLVSRTGKEYLIEDRAAAVRDRQRQIIGTVLVFQDITARLQLECEATKSSRIESIGLLAGGIAHDFNNILTAILGNLSLLKYSTKLPGDVLSRVALAEKATLRARDLTEQLLTFAKGGAPLRQTASLREIVRESTEFALRGSNVRAEFDLAADLSPAEVDSGQIHQVIHNLVLNAVQAMPEGGLVRVKACNYALISRAEAPLPPGNYVRISVRDEGPGIPSELLPKIFDPYFTTKRGGNGLGLATAFSIIKRHDGYLTAESTPGEGAVFYLYLPASSKSIVEAANVGPANYRGAGKILVMDDEEPVLQLACSMLEQFGYQPMAVKDGAEAVIRYNQAKRNGAPFSAVIMDLTIPGGMGGRDALQQIMAGDPEVRAIVSSGYSNDPVMARYREHGFVGVVEKPYTIEELGRALHEALPPSPALPAEAYSS